MKFLRRSLPGCFLALSLVVSVIPVAPACALSVNSLGDFNSIAVMEITGDYSAVDETGAVNLSPRQEVTREFYHQHSDDYDFLVIFTNFSFAMPGEGVNAFFHAVKNDVEGIGLDTFDASNLYSADGSFLHRLEGVIDMAAVKSHVLEPSSVGFEKTLQALTHEMMHRWGAYISFDDDGQESDDLLGADDSHWSFLLDSEGSSLYGNRWVDNGDGTFSTIANNESQSGSAVGRSFNSLELYLMGLLEAEQVPPLTLIESPGFDRQRLPESGVTVAGQSREITIEQIIAATGERIPVAQPERSFRTGFILLVEPGTWSIENPRSLAMLAQIGNLQREWQKRFSTLTHGAGLMSTKLHGSVTPDQNPVLTGTPELIAASPSLAAAVTWLANHQQPDGSWLNQPGMQQRDTALAVAALRNFLQAAAAVSNGQLWLEQQSSSSLDSMAKIIASLDGEGTEELFVRQNQDGGWGSNPGYPSNPLDTSVALSSLVADGNSTQTINAAISYLLDSQLSDGGWSIAGASGQLQATALAVKALGQLRGEGFDEDVISRGLARLLAWQQDDGGFGDPDSTVYQTAQALETVNSLGLNPFATSAAADYLLANQSETGGWRNSIYQTSLALAALFRARLMPDLSVNAVEIVSSPSVVTTYPNEIEISVTVHNYGGAAGVPVAVNLYREVTTPANQVGSQSVVFDAESSVELHFPVSVDSPFDQTLIVVVDAENTVAEASENNNIASTVVDVDVAPPGVGFRATEDTHYETDGAIFVNVDLAFAWDQPITVAVAVDDQSTAESPLDYTLLADTLTFPAGTTSQVVELLLADDLVEEGVETLVVALTATSDGELVGSRHTISIIDDDLLPFVSIQSPQAAVSGDVSMPLLYQATPGTVTVTVDGIPVSCRNGDDLLLNGDGQHLLKVMVTDHLSRQAEDQVSLILDTIAPQITIVSPVSGQGPDSSPLLFYTLDEGAVLDVFLDGEPIAQRAGDRLPVLSDGRHVIRVTAADVVGNISAVEQAYLVATAGEMPPPAETAPLLSDTTELLRTLNEENGWATVDKGGYAYLVTKHGYNVYLYKFNPDGTPSWPEPTIVSLPHTAYSMYSAGFGGGLQIDDCGTIYLAGQTRDDWDFDLFAARVLADGTLEWSKNWGSIQNDNIWDVYLDATGRFYVTGQSEGPISGFGGDNPGEEMFVTVFNTVGDILLNKNFPGVRGSAIAADNQGNLYLAERQLRKYSATGLLLWQRPALQEIDEIVIDHNGDLLIGGHLDGGIIEKIDAEGNLLWTAEPIAPSSSTTTVSWIGVDRLNRATVAGHTGTNLLDHTSLDNDDPYLARFDSTGHTLWVNQLDSPLEGSYLSGAILPGEEILLSRASLEPLAAGGREYVFTRDRYDFESTTGSSGNAMTYYVNSLSSCGEAVYGKGPVVTTLSPIDEDCAGPDMLSMKFKGSKDMLMAYPPDHIFEEATDIEFKNGASSLSFLAQNSAGTGTVSLLEIDPTGNSEEITLDSLQVALRSGEQTIVTDLAGLSGTVRVGKTFGLKLSMSTGARSTNSLQWGNGSSCPTGSRQFITLRQHGEDKIAPIVDVSAPVDGQVMNSAYTLVQGSADDFGGDGIRSVEISIDDGVSWNYATDISEDSSWSAWRWPWLLKAPGDYSLLARVTDFAGNSTMHDPGVNVTVNNLTPTLDFDLDYPLTTASVNHFVSGTVETGAEVTAVIAGPESSTALITELLPGEGGRWSFRVDQLVENVDNVLSVRAENAYGVTTRDILIHVDTIAPALNITQSSGETTSAEFVCDGSVEEGATLEVSVGSAAISEPVTVLNGAWSYLATALSVGDNLLVFTATDAVGNRFSQSVTVRYTPLPDLSAVIFPSSLFSDEQGDVVLRIDNVPIDTDVQVTELLDLNENGTGDEYEPVLRRFVVRDGFYVNNPNVQNDEDWAGLNSIVSTMNYHFVHDVGHIPGTHLFRVRSGASGYEVPFEVNPGFSQQSVSGFVIDEIGNPVAGALVRVENKWGQLAGYCVSGSDGSYLYSLAEPGWYRLLPNRDGFSLDKSQNQVISVAENEEMNYNPVLRIATGRLSGTVVNQESLVGIPGVLVRAENDSYVSTALTGFAGGFELSLPDGDYALFVDDATIGSASNQGYLGSMAPKTMVSITGSTGGHLLTVPHAQVLVNGRVLDPFSLGVSGVPVQARADDASGILAYAITDETGAYGFGLLDQDLWQVSLVDTMVGNSSLVASNPAPVDPTANAGTIDNLVAFPVDAKISGVIHDQDGVPLKDLLIVFKSTTTGAVVQLRTVDDGSYLHGVHSGEWLLTVDAETSGFIAPEPVHITVSAGQVGVADFVLQQPIAAPTVSINAVESPTLWSSQVLSGSRSTGSMVMVFVDTPASICQEPDYPMATSWQCQVSDLTVGENHFSVVATNGTESTSPVDVTIDYQPLENTINITSAKYNSRKKTLAVTATSRHADAGLTLEYAGVVVLMNFDKLFKGEYRWSYLARNVEVSPGQIVVSGIEGSVVVDVN